MRIIFVYKGRYQIRDTKVLEYCSAIARDYDYKTELVWDEDLFGISDNVFSNRFLSQLLKKENQIIDKILFKTPKYVVLFDGLSRQKWNKIIAGKLKQKNPNIFILLLSYWEPEDQNLTCFDKILIGDPETAFNDFFKNKQFSDNAQAIKSDKVADLDSLPLPDTSLFESKINFHDSYLIYTSKGCPYQCSYCEETLYKENFGKNYFRQMSSEKVIRELVKAKKRYNIQEVIFKDSVFASNKAWVLDFLQAYRENINVPFKCFAKSESFDEQIAKAFIASKCYCVEFGVQTFNELIKQEILNRPEKSKIILKAFAICEQLGLRYDADHLFGIPNEKTEDHIQAARIYAGLARINRIKCHNLVYYRNSKIYAYAPAFIKNNNAFESDFFSGVAGGVEMVKINSMFEKYFKVLPLLPKAINNYLTLNNHWKIFRFIPGFVIFFLMLVLALRNKDKRFWIYLKYYPGKIRNMMFD